MLPKGFVCVNDNTNTNDTLSCRMSMLRVCKRGLDWIKLTLLFTVGLFPYGE